MTKLKKLIIACDGESASGKSTAAKLVSKKYKLLLINSGLIYRYCSKMIIQHKPKRIIPFLKKKFKTASYKVISTQKLHSEEISNHVAIIAKNKKVREIVNQLQMKIIMKIMIFSMMIIYLKEKMRKSWTEIRVELSDHQKKWS